MKTKTQKPFVAIAQVSPTRKHEKNADLKYVQDFLVRFGHLEKKTFKTGVLDDPTSKALKSYQRANGRRATGELNLATLDQMTTHRCGLPDTAGSGLSFSTQCAWNKSNLTYAFDIGTSDVGGTVEFQAVRNAFDTWAAVIPLTFTEVQPNQNPDILIGWRPANDPDHSMVGGVLAHADFPPGCSVVTNSLPKPVHFDDEEHAWSIGAVVNAFDVETVALHEIGHILGLAHSNVVGSVMFASVSSNFTKRSLTADDIAGIQTLYPPPLSLKKGTYTIQQKSNNRFLDAHESAGNDFSVVTRTAQNNDTQRWILTPVGDVYTIQQKSGNRFMDAHESAGNDFSTVTRTEQNNDTQRWVVLPVENQLCTYTIQQLSSNRYLDAHQSSANDFSVVTRTAQNNDTQRWTLKSLGSDTFTIQQLSSGRFLDAHESSGNDFSVVTRPAQNNNTQRWIFKRIGSVYTIQQKSSNRCLDAHESSSNDFSAVTRSTQNNDTQRWVILHDSQNNYTIQQLRNGRFLDAHESSTNDFSAVTRSRQNNDTQRWKITPV